MLLPIEDYIPADLFCYQGQRNLVLLIIFNFVKTKIIFCQVYLFHNNKNVPYHIHFFIQMYTILL